MKRFVILPSGTISSSTVDDCAGEVMLELLKNEAATFWGLGFLPFFFVGVVGAVAVVDEETIGAATEGGEVTAGVVVVGGVGVDVETVAGAGVETVGATTEGGEVTAGGGGRFGAGVVWATFFCFRPDTIFRTASMVAAASTSSSNSPL